MSRYIAQCRRTLAFAALFSLFVNLLVLVVPLYTLQVYDRILTSRSLETLTLLTLIVLFALAAFAALDMLRLRLLVRAGYKLEGLLASPVLRQSIIGTLQGAREPWHGLRDLRVLRGFISSNAPIAFFDIPWLPVFIAVLFLFHFYLGAIALAGALFLFGLAVLDDRLSRTAVEKGALDARRAANFADAVLRNAEAVQALGMIDSVDKRWRTATAAANSDALRCSRRSSQILAISRFSRQALQVAILGVGAYLVIRERVSPGVMFAAAIILGRAMAPIESAIASWRSLIEAHGAYRRLNALVATGQGKAAPMTLPAPAGAVQVERVVYAPPRRPAVIKGVSFELAPGEQLGLIGPSGAGKSTLARLLLGVLRPMSGNVRLDGADIAQWDSDRLGGFVGYVPQDVQLFDATVASNIARMTHDEVDAEAVVAAAKLAGAHEIALQLPNGYDTVVGRDGIELSAGQRQRIALARAVYGAPRFVVLDEPNSNLDDDGERALLGMLLALKAKCITTILVTHRPSLVRLADRILVLRDGAVAELGPRDVVLGKLSRPPAGVPSVVRSERTG